jgi:transcription elongation GreA/GreB family factor
MDGSIQVQFAKIIEKEVVPFGSIIPLDNKQNNDPDYRIIYDNRVDLADNTENNPTIVAFVK